MGDYFPGTSYLAAGAQMPCIAPPVSQGAPLGLPSSKACVSRRRLTIRLPRGLRSATVRVAGRRAQTFRGRRLRAHRPPRPPGRLVPRADHRPDDERP